MRALIAGEFWPGSTGAAIADGLRRLGDEVCTVDVREAFLSDSRIVGGVARRLISGRLRAGYNARILAAANEFAAEFVLFIKGSEVLPATVEALRRQGRTTALYYPDVNFEHPGLSFDVIRDVDLVCTTKSFHREFLEDRRAGPTCFVPHGYSRAVHQWREADSLEPHWDLGYVGNPDAAKVELLTAVVARRPDLSIRIAGNRWNSAAANTPLARATISGPVYGDALRHFHQKGRINLGVHGRPPGKHGWADLVSTRTFEIPAARAFMLHVANAEVDGLYAADEVPKFADLEQLLQRIDHYLAQPEERERCRDRAWRRAVPAYSYAERAKQIHEAIILAQNGAGETGRQPLYERSKP